MLKNLMNKSLRPEKSPRIINVKIKIGALFSGDKSVKQR